MAIDGAALKAVMTINAALRSRNLRSRERPLPLLSGRERILQWSLTCSLCPKSGLRQDIMESSACQRREWIRGAHENAI